MPRSFAGAPAFLLLCSCGTTYQLPEPTAADLQLAAGTISAEEQAPVSRSTSGQLGSFERIRARVEPAAEAYCQEHIQRKATCDFRIEISSEAAAPPNAFQHYEDSRPVVTFTPSMLAMARNEDEVAFIMGHEVGHHMGAHISKQQQQTAVGAVIAGSLMALAGAYDPYTPSYVKEQDIENAMYAGAAVGGMAFSQTFELESDMIGARIATAAGYDPVKGSRVFARRMDARNRDGALSFWGTHPPSERRIAIVSATVRAIEEGQELEVRPVRQNQPKD